MQDIHDKSKEYKFLRKSENIFGYQEDEKQEIKLKYSPKKGMTLVKVYNPYTGNGIFLHPNKRTKYMLFNCRFYYSKNLPTTIDTYKTHILELPVLTAFQVYKKAIVRNNIRRDDAIYLVVWRKGKYEFEMKIVPKEIFHQYVENKSYSRKDFDELMNIKDYGVIE